MLLKKLFIYLFYLLVEDKSLKIQYMLIKVNPPTHPYFTTYKIHAFSFSLSLGYEQESYKINKMKLDNVKQINQKRTN